MLSSIKYAVGYLVSVVIVRVTKTFLSCMHGCKMQGKMGICYRIVISRVISIGIDQTVKHALEFKFFLLIVCELPKHFGLLITVCIKPKWELVIHFC